MFFWVRKGKWLEKISAFWTFEKCSKKTSKIISRFGPAAECNSSKTESGGVRYRTVDKHLPLIVADADAAESRDLCRPRVRSLLLHDITTTTTYRYSYYYYYCFCYYYYYYCYHRQPTTAGPAACRRAHCFRASERRRKFRCAKNRRRAFSVIDFDRLH